MTELAFRHATRREVGRFWWLFLLTGSAWLLLAVIVFRFDWSTVSAISILFGVTMLGATVVEVLALTVVDGWWKLAHGLLAAAFAIIGIVAFAHPGNTFSALAAVMSFYFIVRGGFNLVVAIVGRGVNDLWWLQLLIGLAELLIGFWAAGNFGHRVILLVVWVGVVALTRAISDFIFAFELRKAEHAA